MSASLGHLCNAWHGKQPRAPFILHQTGELGNVAPLRAKVPSKVAKLLLFCLILLLSLKHNFKSLKLPANLGNCDFFLPIFLPCSVSLAVPSGFTSITSGTGSSPGACHCFHNIYKSVKGLGWYFCICRSPQAEIWEEFYIFSCLR